MLPVVRDDDGDAIYLLLVTFYESSMIFEGRDILPAVEPGGINQQHNLAVLTDNRIDLRRNLRKVVGLNFVRHQDPQHVARDNVSLDHVKSPSVQAGRLAQRRSEHVIPKRCSDAVISSGKFMMAVVVPDQECWQTLGAMVRAVMNEQIPCVGN